MGLVNLLFRDRCHNETWFALMLAAMHLFAWTKRLCLSADLLTAEPKRLRYSVHHVAARVVRSGRRLFVRVQCS